jgi:hypothetical protein
MFRLDFQTSLFLLPYVVQDVLAAGGGEARPGRIRAGTDARGSRTLALHATHNQGRSAAQRCFGA